MKNKSTKTIVILLAAASAAIYALQLILFHDWKDTAFYMLQDWAFLPIQIALVTVIVGRIMNEREKQARLDKTRILTSTFFSDLGTNLLDALVPHMKNREETASYLQSMDHWKGADFEAAAGTVRNTAIQMDLSVQDMINIRDLLNEKRMTLLVIASNPSLLEHEDFTDMLWAIFHLNDELVYRGQIDELPQTDLIHLNVDAERVLKETLVNWLCHLEFLHRNIRIFISLKYTAIHFKRDRHSRFFLPPYSIVIYQS